MGTSLGFGVFCNLIFVLPGALFGRIGHFECVLCRQKEPHDRAHYLQKYGPCYRVLFHETRVFVIICHQKQASGVRLELRNFWQPKRTVLDTLLPPPAAADCPAAGRRCRRPPLYIQTPDQPPLAALLVTVNVLV